VRARDPRAGGDGSTWEAPVLTLLCDTCGQPISGDGFELTLMPGTLVSGQDSTFRRFTSVTAGVISAILCVPCGERFNAILHHKLRDPCPTCEVAPARAAAARTSSQRHQHKDERAA
jgi:hypothetical protein